MVVLGGHHLHSGADVVRHPNERSPDRTRLAVDEEPEDSSRSRHRPRGAERQPAFGSFEEVSSGTVVSARPELHPIRWRLARLAIDRASRKRDMAASMRLVRCGCRRRSKATAAPALVGRGDLPREPVPEGSSTPDLGDGGGRPELGYDTDAGAAA